MTVPRVSDTAIKTAWTHRKLVGEPSCQARGSCQMASAKRGQITQFHTPTAINTRAQRRDNVTLREYAGLSCGGTARGCASSDVAPPAMFGVAPPATGGFIIESVNIGELARLSGLPVKTIRYYSDIGLVPESGRTGSGYRRYDQACLVRLEFVRTLRELGLDLSTVARVLDHGDDLQVIAAAHADAVSAQIRVLKLRRAALRALARRPASPPEVDRMNRIAQATADERRRIIDGFLDSIFDGVPDVPSARDFQARMRAVSADLPDEPSEEQIDAWIELAELVRDPDFQQRLRTMGQRSFGGAAPATPPDQAGRLAELVFRRAQEAIDAGVEPTSPEAAGLVDELVSAYSTAAGRRVDAEYRQELLDQATLAYEPRAERYWQLLATINGWPPIQPRMHLWGWYTQALHARDDFAC
jgi:DNA-binding transcriptional MerR regulator